MNTLLKKILDLIMPRRCVGCGKKGDFVCESCFETIDFLDVQQCPGCRKERFAGEFCYEHEDQCRKKLFDGNCYFDQLIVCARYDKNGILKKLIEQFKYKYSIELSAMLASMFLSQLDNLYTDCDNNPWDEFKDAWVVPVPLHKKRLKSRGFNQTDLLAFGLVEFYNLAMAPILKRKIFTSPQAHLKREARLTNLKGAFTLIDNIRPCEIKALDGRKIILVDDICTTGSTLNECAKILKGAGCGRITAVVLARGDRH